MAKAKYQIPVLLLTLVSVVAVSYFVFAVFSSRSLIGAFSPSYVELSSDQLRSLSKDELVRLAQSAIAGHKEMTEYAWMTVEFYTLAVGSFSGLLAVSIAMAWMLSRRRHNKSLNADAGKAGAG